MDRLIELITTAYTQSIEDGRRSRTGIRYDVMRRLYGDEDLPVSTPVLYNAIGKLFDKFGTDFEDTHSKHEMESYLDELLALTVDWDGNELVGN